MNNTKLHLKRTAVCLGFIALLTNPPAMAQNAGDSDDGQDIYELSPFVVDASSDVGYLVSSSLAGTRLNTNLSDIGSAISVYNKELLDDIAATDNQTLLSYDLNTEVRSIRSSYSATTGQGAEEGDNFDNPNNGTRVRGLVQADNTTDFFLTDVPWDGYNVDRIDIQRGPNAILFGLGSPAGVINATKIKAVNKDLGSIEFRYDEFGTFRTNLDVNRIILPDELFLRVALLHDEKRYPQKQAFSDNDRQYVAATYEPKALNGEGRIFSVSANFENGNIRSNSPRLLPPNNRFTHWWNDEINQGTVDYLTINPRPHEVNAGGVPWGNWLRNDTSQGPRFLRNSFTNSASDFARMVNKTNMGILLPDWTPNTNKDLNDVVFLDNPWPYILKDLEFYYNGIGVPGIYSKGQIDDPSIFNFYKNLIDGGTKGEWNDFKTYQFNVSSTYFHNKLGFDFSYFDQELQRGQRSLLGWQPAIEIDVNEVLPDGSPNPDVGRAYLLANGASSRWFSRVVDSDRNSWRAQVFAQHDFEKQAESSWWRKFLGFHRLTGLVTSSELSLQNRSMDLYSVRGLDKHQGSDNAFENDTRPAIAFYLSGDLRGTSSPAGANLSVADLSSAPLPMSQASISVFNPTWIAEGVDPGAPWANPKDPGVIYTQSQNPDNYLGFTPE